VNRLTNIRHRKETTLKAEAHVRKGKPLGEGLPEFINPSLLHILEEQHEPPEDKFGDVPAAQLKPEGLEPQYTGVNSYGGNRIKNNQGSEPSYGFAISSGWVSTILPFDGLRTRRTNGHSWEKREV
jgi:hypothetical protein